MKKFFILPIVAAGILNAAANNEPVHHFWVDDSRHHTIINGTAVETVLDFSALDEGPHVLSHVALLPDGTVTSPRRSFFIKTAPIGDGCLMDCNVIIDNDRTKKYECSMMNGIIHMDIDMSDIPDGLHSLTVYLIPKGSSTIISPVSSYFIKLPVGGSKISRYCYWFNDERGNAVTVNCEPPMTPCNFTDLIDVAEMPFRTDSYAFATEEDDIVLTAVHKYNFWAMDNMGRFSATETVSFADHRTQHRIPKADVETIESCSDKPIGNIGSGGMKWYKFKGEVGDSIAISLSREALLELFSPAGEKIIARRGPLVRTSSTATLTETGTYYLTIHDVYGQGHRISFDHIPRNAILSVTPSMIPTGSKCVMLDLFGNGMRNVNKISLRSGSGASYESEKMSLIDNYRLGCLVSFNDTIPDGSYDVVMNVHDELTGNELEVVRKDALKAVYSQGNPDVKVCVVPSRKPGTPYIVNITVSNDSDTPCWGIPVNVACDRDGGRAGYILYVKDFLGDNMSAKHIPWYETDNLFGIGIDGIVFPMVLGCLQPHETRTLRVGVIAQPHDIVGLYAWAGMPYSAEGEELMKNSADSLNAMRVPFSNILDLKTAAYILSALEETEDKKAYIRTALPERAPADDNHVLEIMREYGPELAQHYRTLERPAGYADNVARIYNGVAETAGGLVNAGAASHSFIELENRHIPGATLSEKLRNVEVMYGGFDNIGPEAADIKYYYLQGMKELSRAKAPEDIFADATGNSDWLALIRAFMDRNTESANPMPTRHEIEVLMSGDPNDITGYTDLCGGKFVGKHVSEVEYAIEFENDPAIASAPASYVEVLNQLDGDVFDLSSLKSASIEIGNRLIEIPARQFFVTTVDMRPEIRCLVEIRQEYSSETGLIKWTFNSLDPLTLEPVSDYTQGFLPVNGAEGKGSGRIVYGISLKDGLAHNRDFSNSASIVFDNNAPVTTPVWTNTTDYVLPSARITKAYPFDGEGYSFDVSAEDEGSGILYYDLYMRIPDDNRWMVVMPQQTERHIKFITPREIEGAEFGVMATDRAGNRQTEIMDGTQDEISTPEVLPDEKESFYDLLGRPADNRYSKGIYIGKNRKVLIK